MKKRLSYSFDSQIYDYLITGLNGEVIRPRVKKSKEEQNDRIRNLHHRGFAIAKII